MKIHDCEQGSEAWHYLRCRIPTASEFDNLITPAWKLRTGETPRTYLCSKLAAAWQGHPLPSFSSRAIEDGKMLEEEAIPWFELDHEPINRVGFVTDDDWWGKTVGSN